jgi:large exoprotein involved in heme utilization and adhesion
VGIASRITNPDATANGGSLNLNVGELILDRGGTLNLRGLGSGKAGNINVVADDIELDNQSSIDGTTAAGLEGNINLQAQTLQLRGDSRISTDAGDANGGNITLQTQRLQLSENSAISATAGGIGNGGNLAISTELLTLLDESSITANAFEGLGGNIQINAQGLFLSRGSRITASSQLGVDGLVEIEEPEIGPNAGLLDVETKINRQPPVVASVCDRAAGSEFIISGRRNLPPTPEELANNQVSTWLDWRLDEQKIGLGETFAPLEAATTTETKTIVEAKGWVKNNNGVVQLIAPSRSNSTLPPPSTANGCSL